MGEFQSEFHPGLCEGVYFFKTLITPTDFPNETRGTSFCIYTELLFRMCLFFQLLTVIKI